MPDMVVPSQKQPPSWDSGTAVSRELLTHNTSKLEAKAEDNVSFHFCPLRTGRWGFSGHKIINYWTTDENITWSEKA